MNNASRRIATLLLVVFTCASAAYGDIIPIDLLGQAGPGLLPGNETGAVNGTPGSGGEVGSGITFDNVTLQLTINIGWGSGNGFTDLTGNATVGHIHGPTGSPPPTAFEQAASPLIDLHTLPGWNNSATNGGFSNTIMLTSQQATFLNEGRLYINVHTTQNGPGEIRGNLVVVPEPGTFVSLLLGAGALALLRRWRVARD